MNLNKLLLKFTTLKKTNIVTGCIYRHPSMNPNELNESYLNNLLEKLSKENKTVFFHGDFNINLNYDREISTNDFLDSLFSYLLLFHILQPKRMSSNSKTLIDNIFAKAIFPNILLRDLTSFQITYPALIALHIFLNPPSLRSNIYERD